MQIATFKVESNNKKNKKNVVELYLFLFLFFDEMEVIKIDAKRDFQNKANTKYKFVLSILKKRSTKMHLFLKWKHLLCPNYCLVEHPRGYGLINV